MNTAQKSGLPHRKTATNLTTFQDMANKNYAEITRLPTK